MQEERAGDAAEVPVGSTGQCDRAAAGMGSRGCGDAGMSKVVRNRRERGMARPIPDLETAGLSEPTNAECTGDARDADFGAGAAVEPTRRYFNKFQSQSPLKFARLISYRDVSQLPRERARTSVFY